MSAARCVVLCGASLALSCVTGERPTCISDIDCVEGACVGGACRAPSADGALPSDRGAVNDTGAADRGVVDAGEVDAASGLRCADLQMTTCARAYEDTYCVYETLRSNSRNLSCDDVCDLGGMTCEASLNVDAAEACAIDDIDAALDGETPGPTRVNPCEAPIESLPSRKQRCLCLP